MVIFDLDGTLYRTHETGLQALREMCGRYDLAVAPEDERYYLYTTAKDLLKKIAPDMPDQVRERFGDELKWREIEIIRETGRLFEGIPELLAELAADRIPMAICGMGSKEYIEAVIEHRNINNYFKYVYPRVEGFTKSQRLRMLLDEAEDAPDECVFIGDSVTDLTAALDCGVPFIGVSWGYGIKEIADSAEIVRNVPELKSLIYSFLIFSKIEKGIKNLKKPLIIGINGVDTSGKSAFSGGLQKYLNYRGFNTLMIHVDDFHNPQSVRSSDNTPEGYIAKAFDTEKLAELLCEIKSGPVDKQIDLLDLDTDTYSNKKQFKVKNDTIVIVEGVLLYRPPLDEYFDYRIFLDISFDEALRRARVRDVPKYGEEFLQKYIDRYIPAQKIYLHEYTPKERSNLVVDNNDFNKPFFYRK